MNSETMDKRNLALESQTQSSGGVLLKRNYKRINKNHRKTLECERIFNKVGDLQPTARFRRLRERCIPVKKLIIII